MEEILSFNAEFNLLVDRQSVEETRAREEMETMDREEKSLNEGVLPVARSEVYSINYHIQSVYCHDLCFLSVFIVFHIIYFFLAFVLFCIHYSDLS